MENSQPPRAETADLWIDFETLVAQCVARLRADGSNSRHHRGDVEPFVRGCWEGICENPAAIVRAIGGDMDFQEVDRGPGCGFDVRYRIRLGAGSEPIVLPDLRAFLDWLHENRPALHSWVERNRIATGVDEPKAISKRPARQAL